MYLESCIQIHSVVFALSRQINKQKICETINFFCAGDKRFVKYQAQGGGFNPTTPLAHALAANSNYMLFFDSLHTSQTFVGSLLFFKAMHINSVVFIKSKVEDVPCFYKNVSKF